MPKNVVCKRCVNLVNEWCEKVIDSPDPDMQRDCQHFREKTNADRIRSMSDEELAVFLADEVPHGDCCDCWLSCTDCKSDWFEWLHQPAELPKEE